MISSLDLEDSRFVSITAWVLILAGIGKVYGSFTFLLIECSFSVGPYPNCGSGAFLTATLMGLFFGVAALIVGYAFLKDRDPRTPFKYLAWLYLAFALGNIGYNIYAIIDIGIPRQTWSETEDLMKTAQLKNLTYMAKDMVWILCKAILVVWAANRIAKTEVQY